MAACKKLEAAGAAANCRAGQPKMLTALATEVAEFDLPGVAGKNGQVMSFKDSRDYNDTSEKFRAAAMLAGPHRYGSEKALIFAQLNDKAPPALGAKAKAVIDEL
jgi:hypothetical protein